MKKKIDNTKLELEFDTPISVDEILKTIARHRISTVVVSLRMVDNLVFARSMNKLRFKILSRVNYDEFSTINKYMKHDGHEIDISSLNEQQILITTKFFNDIDLANSNEITWKIKFTGKEDLKSTTRRLLSTIKFNYNNIYLMVDNNETFLSSLVNTLKENGSIFPTKTHFDYYDSETKFNKYNIKYSELHKLIEKSEDKPVENKPVLENTPLAHSDVTADVHIEEINVEKQYINYTGILSSSMISSYGLVRPFIDKTSELGGIKVPSYGSSGYGYDVSLSEEDIFILPQDNSKVIVIDPKNFNSDVTEKIPCSIDENGLKFFLLQPNSTALCMTKEFFTMPANVIGVVHGKSTYSRCGLVVNTTVVENGWIGNLVLELHSIANKPIKIYANAGIAQIIFHKGFNTDIIYSGKYQNQSGMTFAKC